VKICWVIEWNEVIVVHRARVAAPRKMIDNDVYHQVHSTGVNSRGKCFQIVSASKVLIERVKILLPIAMIRFTIGCNLGCVLVSLVLAHGVYRPTQLFGDGRYPYLLIVSTT